MKQPLVIDDLKHSHRIVVGNSLADLYKHGYGRFSLHSGCTFNEVVHSSRTDGSQCQIPLPALPVHTPWLFAGLVAISIDLAAGVTPAMRSVRLDPVEAQHAE